MPRARSIKLFATIVTLTLVLMACYLTLSGQTFYADLVAGTVRNAIEESAPLAMSWDTTRGNPLTGVYISNVKISSGDIELASAREIGMQVALPTVASPAVRLSRLTFSDLVTDVDNFSGISFEQKENSDSFPVDNLYFSNSTLHTPWGTLNMERGSIGLGGHAYRIDIRGIFADTPFSLECNAQMNKTELSDYQAIDVNNFKASLLNMNISAAGRVTPSLQMTGEVNNFDFKKLAEILPFLDEYDLEGLYATSFYVTNPNIADFDSLEISGNLTGRAGKVLGMPLSVTSANFHYSNGLFQVRNGSVEAFNGNISGDVDLRLSSGEIPTITARIHSNSIDTASLTPLLPWISNFAGMIDVASCDLAGPVNAISARGRLASSSLNVASFSCSNIDATIVVDKGSSARVDFIGNIQGAPAKGTGNIAIGEHVIVSADVAIPKISAASFRSNFPQLADFKVESDAAVSLGIRGPASALSYAISLSSPELGLMDEYRLSDASAELLYTGNTLNVKSARAKWQDALLTAEGNATLPQGGAPAKLDFNGSFSNLNFARLGDMASVIKDFNLGGLASGSWSISGDTAKPISSVEILFPKFFIYGKYVLMDFRAAFDYASPSVNLKSSGFKLGDSLVTASGTVTLPQNERTMEYNVKGSFNNLDPAVFVSMGLVSQDIAGTLTGDARVWKTTTDAAPSIRLFFKNSELNYSNTANLSLINGTVTYSGGGLQFDNLRTQINNGNISLDGTVGNIMDWKRPESVQLNLKAAVTSADIGRITRMFNPASKRFQGLANVNATIKGSLESPDYTAEGALRAVRAFGLFLPIINFSDVKGNKENIELSNIRAVVGRGNINASGSINMANNWETNLKATGTSVDIRSLTATLDDEMRREITGTLDFNFEGNGPMANFRGKGRGSVPNLSVFGLKMTDVHADVAIADGLVIVENSSAKAYGGNLTAQMMNDLNRTNWEGHIDVTSVDMGPLFHDLVPDSEGSITGKTNFFVQFYGDSRRTSMQDGNGNLEILDGEVSGFEGAKAVSNMVGGRPLMFRSAHFTFTLDGHTIYILPGSRITAPLEAPVYKYITLDGSITTQQEIDLSCMGNVNIRALNAMIAGFQGVLTTTVESGELGDTGDLLRNFLGNTITGFSRNEFRDVNLHIAGKPGDIKFSDITVQPPVRVDSLPPALRNPDGYTEDRGIRLKVEIPVGPGGEGSGNSGVTDQLGSQILDQLIKGLIFDYE